MARYGPRYCKGELLTLRERRAKTERERERERERKR